jgi:hypothetical protein
MLKLKSKFQQTPPPPPNCGLSIPNLKCLILQKDPTTSHFVTHWPRAESNHLQCPSDNLLSFDVVQGHKFIPTFQKMFCLHLQGDSISGGHIKQHVPLEMSLSKYDPTRFHNPKYSEFETHSAWKPQNIHYLKRFMTIVDSLHKNYVGKSNELAWFNIHIYQAT